MRIGIVLLQALQAKEPVSARWIRLRLKVSKATSKRYMRDLERFLPLERIRIDGESVLVPTKGARL